MPAKAWQHIALVRQGTVLTIYKDAVETGRAASPEPGAPVDLGPFEGKLDEVAWFPRALPASEVAAHRNAR